MIGAIVGAKLFQLIGFIIRDGSNPGFWTIENWKNMLPGGGVFYGGLIGGLIAALIYIRKNKLDFWEVTDILVPSVLLFHTFGRLGCFFAGCCYGGEATWGITFTHSLIAPKGVSLIPVQLFEAGFNLLVLIAILIVRPERKRPRILLPLYLMVYAIGRFVLEFFRGDIGRGIYLLSTSQWISLLIFPAGLALLLWQSKASAPTHQEGE
jgi:phosphatidylglycerol:prolipoprotein diacylglycerol transferase